MDVCMWKVTPISGAVYYILIYTYGQELMMKSVGSHGSSVITVIHEGDGGLRFSV
jgi:hypothetical protein